jgi:hypothetical protein
LAARRDRFRRDHSNEWRGEHEKRMPAPDEPEVRYTRSVPYSKVVDRRRRAKSLRIALLGDTGDGDRSQYGLLPILRYVDADLLIINGDIAYPAGRLNDYIAGFFEPYNDLGVPVWAVPGNHEYYSKHRGQEFFDVFCSWKHQDLWNTHGLIIKPQPGSYWELSEPERTGIVIIGLDTGKSGDLDGARRKHRRADAQHTWLEWRLAEADRAGHKVIVLFHIPALVNEDREPKVHLNELHAILGRHPCVKLVTCGHVHNLQTYSPARFREFIGLGNQPPHDRPHYIVCGGGGAYLSATNFSIGPFPAEYRYPNADQWREYAHFGWRLLENNVLGPTIVGRLGATLKERFALDSDVSDYLSFLVIDIDFHDASDAAPGANARVTPVFHDSLRSLYNVTAGTRINVRNRNPPVDPIAADRMLQHARAINL